MSSSVETSGDGDSMPLTGSGAAGENSGVATGAAGAGLTTCAGCAGIPSQACQLLAASCRLRSCSAGIELRLRYTLPLTSVTSLPLRVSRYKAAMLSKRVSGSTGISGTINSSITLFSCSLSSLRRRRSPTRLMIKIPTRIPTVTKIRAGMSRLGDVAISTSLYLWGGWHTGQKCVPRCPTIILSINVPQTGQGWPLRP